MDFIHERVASSGDSPLAHEYGALGELFEKKLWHELTLRVAAFVASNSDPEHWLGLLDRFLPKFEQRINQLKYAQILCGIVSRCAGTDELSAEAAIGRLEKVVADKGDRLGVEASVYVEMEAAMLKLKYFPDKSIKDQLDAATPTIEALTGTTDVSVFHKYYSARAAFYKMAGPPEEFYRAALSVLSYTSEDDMSPAEQYELATDMSLAALAGDGVYNFGEVLATPILGVLESTPNAWLGELLRAVSRGDVAAFAGLVETHADAVKAQPALADRFDFVKEKIALLALMNLLFETPAHARTLSFATIAQRASLPLDQVEWLAMRAMALGLVKGHIDQVDAKIQFTWVAPKVLDHSQIKHLITQLDALSDKATTALSIIHDQTLDLL